MDSERIEMDKELRTAEMTLKDDSSAINKTRKRLPDFLVQFYGLKPNWIYELWTNQALRLQSIDAATRLAVSLALFFLFRFYFTNRSRPVYLVDFACYKSSDDHKVSIESFLKMNEETGAFTDDVLQFQRRICTRSGLGDETYTSRGALSRPPNLCMEEARSETEAVMFGALDSLFEKTGVKPKDIDILIVNCSLSNPAPSFSAMIINHYKLRTDTKSYNLSGMGCSASLISVELAKNLFRANPNTYAVVVSTENITENWYSGNDRSMLLCNCLFRVGGAAVLLSNKPQERARSKYELLHLVRTHKGADDKHYNCVHQREDDKGTVGVSLGRDLMVVAGDALKTNIATLGPLVLPLTEQLMFFVTLVRKKVFKAKVKPYIPNFKLAFEHFCIHAGGRAILEGAQKNLQLTDWHMEPSTITLHRFGNISSSSIWYELAYTEAKGRIAGGDRVWQIAFGSGFKCNSAVWIALKSTPLSESRGNPWKDEIDKYPVKVTLA